MDYSILVNQKNPLDEHYIPDDLVLICEPTGKKVDHNYLNMLNKEAYENFKQMQKAAFTLGYEIFIDSSYRSYQYQDAIFNALVNEKGGDYAEKYVARPGSSEHQTGLAIDIIFRRNNVMIENQTDHDPEIIWLMHNSYKYGYILRYPKDKQDITNIAYEPWHYRFVGKDLAYELYSQGITLEEFYQKELIK